MGKDGRIGSSGSGPWWVQIGGLGITLGGGPGPCWDGTWEPRLEEIREFFKDLPGPRVF